MAIRKLNVLILDLASGMQLAIPEVMRAEIIEQGFVSGRLPGQAPWFLGFMAWRGLKIPVVDPGGRCSTMIPALTTIQHFVVIFGLEQWPDLAYYALPLSDAPHRLRLGPDDMSRDEDSSVADYKALAMYASFSGYSVGIPQISYFEKQIHSQLDSGFSHTP